MDTTRTDCSESNRSRGRSPANHPTGHVDEWLNSAIPIIPRAVVITRAGTG